MELTEDIAVKLVSIHASAREATREEGATVWRLLVSIHASAREATLSTSIV